MLVSSKRRLFITAFIVSTSSLMLYMIATDAGGFKSPLYSVEEIEVDTWEQFADDAAASDDLNDLTSHDTFDENTPHSGSAEGVINDTHGKQVHNAPEYIQNKSLRLGSIIDPTGDLVTDESTTPIVKTEPTTVKKTPVTQSTSQASTVSSTGTLILKTIGTTTSSPSTTVVSNHQDGIGSTILPTEPTSTSTPAGTTTVPATTTLPACPSHGVVHARAGGRTGNLMWEYAAAFVISKRTGLQPFVDPEIRTTLDVFFANLSVPAREMQHCPFPFNIRAHGDLHDTPDGDSIQIYTFGGPDYGGLVEIIVNHLPEVKSEFTFHPHLVDHAQQVLQSARRNADTVFIGVHARRTDYKYHLSVLYNSTQADDSFYAHALDKFRSNYKEAVFIVVSDDLEWCRQHLSSDKSDIVFSKGTPAQDMATLSVCNHTIIDYGTFGEWSSLFAGGETIVYDLTKFNDHTTNLAKLRHWTLLS